jgi:hypothetical protein
MLRVFCPNSFPRLCLHCSVPTTNDELMRNRTVTTTTFGYHAQQDRIWMRVHEEDRTLWLTRRMVLHILGPMLASFESTTPGSEGGAPTGTRAAIEHDLALHEVVPGQPPARIQSGNVTPSEHSDPQQDLCSRIVTQSGSQSVSMSFDTGTGPLVLRLDRKSMHLWLQGLVMVLNQTGWNLADPLPGWLQSGVMPPAIQALIAKPLPKDLDAA